MKIELLCVLFFPLSVIRFKGLCVGRCFSRTAQSVFGVVLRRSTQNDFSPEAVKSRHDGHFAVPFFTETYQKKLLFVPYLESPGQELNLPSRVFSGPRSTGEQRAKKQGALSGSARTCFLERSSPRSRRISCKHLYQDAILSTCACRSTFLWDLEVIAVRIFLTIRHPGGSRTRRHEAFEGLTQPLSYG